MNKDQCCNHDCNQGRKCPVREGTHKPAEAVHQIHEPTVNHQLTIEREFEDWWTDSPEMNEFLFQNGIDDSKGGQQSLFFAAAYIAWKARAALAATPADHVADAGKMVLPEPDHWLIESRGEKTYMTASRFTASSFDTASYTKLYTEQQVRALLATGGQAQEDIAIRLYSAIEHGDKEHREWLACALNAFFKGQPIPKEKSTTPQAQAEKWGE